jgi:uncharacterized protein (DUF1684 family)
MPLHRVYRRAVRLVLDHAEPSFYAADACRPTDRAGALWHIEGVRRRMRWWLAGLVLVAAACESRSPDEIYLQKIASARAAKEELFKGAESPVKPEDREKYLPLSYFAPDVSYAVPAQFRESPDKTFVKMPTSTGKIRDMERVGQLEFTLHGQKMTLAAFVEAGTDRISRLFVPFSDLTSGTETYQAGRYMDLDPEASGVYIVDFNVAYHPYCYYNIEYDCPFPPPENRLKTPVRAGERLRTADRTLAR